MISWLRNMTPGEQVGALFLLVFGLLAVATSVVHLLLVRHEDQQASPANDRLLARLNHSRVLLRVTWAMVLVFWLGWSLGPRLATFLFSVVSFFMLREFVALSPTRRGDHRSLVLAFFVVLPVQFLLVATQRFNLFTVFIPVYVFLAIPIVSALADDPQHFLERNAKLQWGIMVCVYGMSHVPALLLLEFPAHRFAQWQLGRNAFLVFFLVFVVQTTMLAQHLASRRWPRAPQAPAVSQSFNWPSWAIGVGAGAFMGVLLTGITPFVAGQALGMSLIACVAGSLGHLVMKAIKRDRGVPSWGGRTRSITGANGMLDRMDALCFAAPVFFHSVRWYFQLP